MFADVQAGLGSQGYDFSAPDPYQALRVEGQDPHQRVEAPQALAQSTGEQTAESDLAYGTTMGVVGDNLSSGFGWIVARLGTNTPDSLAEGVPGAGALDRLPLLQCLAGRF